LKCQKKGIKKQEKKTRKKTESKKLKNRNKKILVKVANLYCNQELMTMATNLYYHCWFTKAGLQETHLF
jgi:hypothetical protein